MDKDAAVSETRTTRCHQCGFAVPTFDWEDAYDGIKAERDALRAEVELLTRGRQADQDMAVAANERAVKAEADVERLREELFQVRRAHTELLGCFNASANSDRDCKRVRLVADDGDEG